MADLREQDDMAEDTAVWRRHPVYHLYEVSDDGRVRSLPRPARCNTGVRMTAERILKLHLDKDGYWTVRIRHNNARVAASVHRLMCEAFHGLPCQAGRVVRHLNGVRTDNRPSNLAWGTPADNTHDMLEHGNHAESRKTVCPRGHLYDEANTYVERKSNGGTRRRRRTCVRDQRRDYCREYQRRKAREARMKG